MNLFIYTSICHINDSYGHISQLWIDKYGISSEHADQIIQEKVKPYFRQLKDNLYCAIEYPYVDKMYRDTFYHYYSSKLELNQRDSIRISFFDIEIKKEDFCSEEGKRQIQDGKHYLGFLTLRPTFPKVTGRTGLSPKAKKDNDFLCCLAKINATVNAVKFDVDCYPHSSQDNQTITCAETTIWSLLEYFGNKYPEYKPVLPSTIHQLLHPISYKRQMPSEGLTTEQVTYAVRELGFGAIIYSRNKNVEIFDEIISTYVESGIPVVAVLNDVNRGMGHAVNIIGRKKIDPHIVINTPPEVIHKGSGSRIKIIDFNQISNQYIFIDDNHPPYQLAGLAKPCKEYYDDDKWHDCNITNIIVPLYTKIYLEAIMARHNFYQYLKNSKIGIMDDETRVVRVFLASSRSYKEYLSLNKILNIAIKRLFLSVTMPKFIWVGEISKSTSFEKGHCDGIILQDATEPSKNTDNTYWGNLSLIAGYLGDQYFTQHLGVFKSVSTFIHSFENYQNNLK